MKNHSDLPITKRVQGKRETDQPIKKLHLKGRDSSQPLLSGNRSMYEDPKKCHICKK